MMEVDDVAVDGRTFKADFTDAGVDQLRERMREKLREFKDAEESLVEYVIVLLRNGRRKDEARKELHIFLGVDESASFVSWLWDHLSLNLHLYVKTQEKREVGNKDDGTPKELYGGNKSSETHSRNKDQTHVEHTSESNTATRSRNKREWKVIGREGNKNFPLRSVLTDILHGEEKKPQKSTEIRQPPSSNQRNGRKRDREDEPQQTKRELPSRPLLGTSRRLLQFAVRDAVKAVQPTSGSTETSSKRLRSVVSTATDNMHGRKLERSADSLPDRRSERSTDSLHDRRSERTTDSLNDRRSERSTDNLNDKRSDRTRILQVPGAALALRAAKEAAADSSKARSTRSVFSRLGQGNVVNQPSRSREEKKDHEDIEPATTVDGHDSDHDDNDDEISGDLHIPDGDAEMNVDSTSDDDVDIDDEISRYQSSDSHRGALSSVVKNYISTKCSAEPETNTMRHSSLTSEEQPLSSLPIRASKTVAAPVNLNPVEPPNYGALKDVHVVEKPDTTPMNANVTSPAINVKELGHGEVQKDSQRPATSAASSYSTAHTTEDADSRTLYVSNVHFAATKDSLSRHFNKFGAVLKVVIVTNAATGQPTGSAYVEFLHTESAERALSLNGTSFMTRLLQVVRRSSHEAAHFYGWPGSGRSSMYARHSRMAYPRGVLPGSSFRGRTPMKAGARSFQWKREPSGTDSNQVQNPT